jgi:ATP-binding cassette, subfamily B, bacterial HlyB/CyaB
MEWDLKAGHLSRAGLSETDFMEADLSGANLSGADLGGADLRFTNLSRADLSERNLIEADVCILRTYLFAHTTNRIDVELGARLFRHLLALPMAYFQARRVGDSVARVRELENIRNFLTSSALTLVIDLFFTFVFLAVLFYYSPLLTWIVLGSFPFYIAISAGATPLFRQRLNEKFQRGAENQAFLVESVTGIETLKAMAVEPQMQRRWEEQLAAYVATEMTVVDTATAAVLL